MKSSMMMMMMMTKIQVQEGEEEREGMVECHQDHHQIYMVETPQQKFQVVLLKQMKKDFKIED